MNTPIFDFVNNYRKSDAVRFHMPGHKGKNFLGIENSDITEIGGADVLYSPEGIILQSENNASGLFGTAHTFYSAEGSSLSIKAMLGLAKSYFGDSFKILAGRNAHKAFVYSCALLDIEPEWIYGKDSNLCSCNITADDVEKEILKTQANVLYLTSPDYLGNMLDIKAIASVCKKYGCLLLVDNAHGAYLKFLEEDMHPITLGADMCCDSAHKTLPVLTGGAYLQISKNADSYFCDNARSMLSLFASTSPSYLILQSLDLCNKYLSENYRCDLENTVRRIEEIKLRLRKMGFTVVGSEKLKIVIDANKSGYRGTELGSILSKTGIECEFADRNYLVLMITNENSAEDFEKLLNVMNNIKQLKSLNLPVGVPNKAKKVMSIRKAVFAPKETVNVKDAAGRICASVTVSCPPAIPIAVSGEEISADAVEIFCDYGIEKIEVIK